MMAPRHDEEDTAMAAVGTPTLLQVQPYGVATGDTMLTASVGKTNFNFEDSSQAQLQAALKQRADVGNELLQEVNTRHGESRSPTIIACKGSLSWEFPLMLAEANAVVESLNKEGLMVTHWRASLAQTRVESYLHSIDSLLKAEEKSSYDSVLTRVLDPVLAVMGEEKTADLPVRVSSWRTPSLAFDIELGHSVEHSHEASPPSDKCDFDIQRPMKVHVKAIADIAAKDIVSGCVGSYEPCSIKVERCRHEEKQVPSNLSFVEGEAMLKVRISPVGSGKKPVDDQVWDTDNHVKVEEARVIQTNAFPPEAKDIADLYTSTVHGLNDATVSLRFNTFRTLNNEPPELVVELVVGGH